jgi:hypothetical protein
VTVGRKTRLATVLTLLVLRCGAPAARIVESYVQGTVSEVRKERVQSPEYTIGGSNPSDAPLAIRFYSFEIAIRVGCKTYVGRYRTPMNYLPAAFAAGQRIGFRLGKHVMSFDLPYSAEVRMPIVRRKDECGNNRQ